MPDETFDSRCTFCDAEGDAQNMRESDDNEVMCAICRDDYTLEEMFSMGFDS